MVVWIFLNLAAGKREIPTDILEVLKEKLSSIDAIAFWGAFGCPSVVGLSQNRNLVTAASVKELVERFSKGSEPDVIVGIGGDGTMNMIANIMANRGIGAPLMGIGVGTGNVGPLVRFNLQRLKDVDFSQLEFEFVGALEAVSENKLGLAFVDVVVSRTFLGTLGGRRVDFDAVAYLKSGELREVKRVTRKVATKDFVIELNGKTVFKGNRGVKQIAAAPLYRSEFYVGKAATGMLCYAHHTGRRAVVVLSDHPTIVAKPRSPKKAVTIRQIVFGEGDVVVMKHLVPGNAIVLDGNPVALANNDLMLRYHKKAVKTVVPPDGSFLPLTVLQ